MELLKKALQAFAIICQAQSAQLKFDDGLERLKNDCRDRDLT